MTEYKVELVNGMGYLVYADYSELALSRMEVEYILNAQEEEIQKLKTEILDLRAEIGRILKANNHDD